MKLCGKPASSGQEEDGWFGCAVTGTLLLGITTARPAMPSVSQMKRAVNGGKPLIISCLPAASEPAAGSCIRVRIWGRMNDAWEAAKQCPPARVSRPRRRLQRTLALP